MPGPPLRQQGAGAKEAFAMAGARPLLPLSLFAALVATLLAPALATAAPAKVTPASAKALAPRAKATDFPLRYDDYRVRYDVNADGTYEQVTSYTRTVLKESALDDARGASFSYSTSVEQGEVVEAWTQKASGQRLPVPASNYQLHTAGGRGEGGPFFSDRSSVSVVFPDVAVGDQVHLTWRRKVKEAIFPGQFTLREQFSPYTAHVIAEVEITVPVAMTVQQQAWNLQAGKPTVANGRRSYRWTWRNPLPERWTAARGGIERLEDEPVLLFSTLRSYRDITEAYGARARPKAAVTPRLQALADSIVPKDAAPADKARALYEWIQKNITYGGNCIGIGAVVPRDLDVVLDNRIGDCKDRATLLQALLTAVGVPGTQALVNAGGLYELPEVPVVANINHAINYLPTLNLYLDSTSSDTPFGRLPFGSADKPVLLMDGYRTGARTPPETGEGDAQRTVTRLKLNADGSASGEVEISARGLPAISMRRGLRELPAERHAEAVKRWLKGAGFDGSGELQLEPVTITSGDYQLRARFTIKDYLQNPEAGAFLLRPILSGPSSIRALAGEVLDEAPERASACAGGNVSEEYVIELPAAMTVLYLPKSRALAHGDLRYEATYASQGNALTLTRKLSDRVARNVCAPALRMEQQGVVREISRELRSQVLYRQEM